MAATIAYRMVTATQSGDTDWPSPSKKSESATTTSAERTTTTVSGGRRQFQVDDEETEAKATEPEAVEPV